MPGEDFAVDCGEYHRYHMAAFPLWDGSWHVRQATSVGLLQENFIFPLGTWDENETGHTRGKVEALDSSWPSYHVKQPGGVEGNCRNHDLPLYIFSSRRLQKKEKKNVQLRLPLRGRVKTTSRPPT